jgi:Fe-S-cluster-containing dehydrogenase component
MANYGFAIDLRKCIGCHACTIACKAEHEIPVGVNRCWVKTVEKGSFPDTRRFFFPVSATSATRRRARASVRPSALFKRRDGIVDLHGDSCIGCRACMEACPYDQLFIDPNTHTAEKCNFCANRVENKLLPACVSVCPTECRIFGDLDDPTSEVSRIVQHEAFMVRKPEKGTGRRSSISARGQRDPAGSGGPAAHVQGRQVHLRPIGAPEEDPESPGAPRVDYDIPHASRGASTWSSTSS